MRIAFFTDTFTPQVNGVVTSVTTLSEELERRGHDVLVLAPRPAKRDASLVPPSKNVETVLVGSVPIFFYPDFRFSIFFFVTAYRRLKAFKPDVIHVQTPLSVGVAGVILSRIMRVPLVGTQHVYITTENADFLRFLRAPALIKRVVSWFAHYSSYAFFGWCDLVVAPSRELVDAIKRDGFKKPVQYLSNGLRLSDFRILSDDERSSLIAKYDLHQHVILHVGRLSKEKSVDTLIRAFARMKTLTDDASLVIIGGGPAENELCRLCRELKVEDSVRFLGMIPHDELLSSGILSLGTLFATASTMEAQGMVVLEAMCVGLPITCVGKAGVTELVDGNGLLSAPGNTEELARNMHRILTDEPLRLAMGQASLRLAEKYSVASMAERLTGLYTEVLAARLR